MDCGIYTTLGTSSMLSKYLPNEYIGLKAIEKRGLEFMNNQGLMQERDQRAFLSAIPTSTNGSLSGNLLNRVHADVS